MFFSSRILQFLDLDDTYQTTFRSLLSEGTLLAHYLIPYLFCLHFIWRDTRAYRSTAFALLYEYKAS